MELVFLCICRSKRNYTKLTLPPAMPAYIKIHRRKLPSMDFYMPVPYNITVAVLQAGNRKEVSLYGCYPFHSTYIIPRFYTFSSKKVGDYSSDLFVRYSKRGKFLALAIGNVRFFK